MFRTKTVPFLMDQMYILHVASVMLEANIFGYSKSYERDEKQTIPKNLWSNPEKESELFIRKIYFLI